MSVAAFKHKGFYNVEPTKNGQSKQQKYEQRMKSAQSQLERQQDYLFIVNFEQISYQFWRIEMMEWELLM